MTPMRPRNNRRVKEAQGASRSASSCASSYSSSSSDSSTDTEMGFVDVCSILCDKSEAEGRCEGGPITLDLTKWDFSKADGRNRCRKLIENSEPLWLIGSPIDSGRDNKERARGGSALGIHL